jgi:hypothetical protein
MRAVARVRMMHQKNSSASNECIERMHSNATDTDAAEARGEAEREADREAKREAERQRGRGREMQRQSEREGQRERHSPWSL